MHTIHTQQKPKDQRVIKREIGYGIFAAYMIFVFSSTILPEVYIDQSTINVYYPGGSIGAENAYFNIVPGRIFSQIAFSLNYLEGGAFYISFLGNLFLLFPVGILFSLLFDDAAVKNLCLGAGISLFIEISQLFLPRAADIDDILLNTAGMLIGCAAVKIVRALRNKKAPRARCS